MNLYNFSNNYKEIFKNAGYKIENREYTKEEIKQAKTIIMDYAMSKSLKSKDSAKTLNDCIDIYNILDTKVV